METEYEILRAVLEDRGAEADSLAAGLSVERLEALESAAVRLGHVTEAAIGPHRPSRWTSLLRGGPAPAPPSRLAVPELELDF